MPVIPFLIILVSLFAMELIYFKIADHFNIIDKPNARSSHNSITLRGGGVIFTISILLWFVSYGFQLPFFLIGLIAITLISFLDDILTLNNKIRLVIHLSAVFLLLTQWNLFAFPWYCLIISLIFIIGAINAYNFMDGINGITGSYSFLAIATLYYINETTSRFTDPNLLIIIALSLLVFNFFNFRKKAICFAGDVGSVSIAFVIIFLIGQLILATSNFNYILLLFIYGLDTATTIGFRKIRKENIFEAHRSHFYQYLANQLKWNHLVLAMLYFATQLICNAVLIFIIEDNSILAIIFGSLVLLGFVGIRFWIEGSDSLLKRQSFKS